MKILKDNVGFSKSEEIIFCYGYMCSLYLLWFVMKMYR